MPRTTTGPVPPAGPAAPRDPGEAVALLAARRATGALHGPLGTLYLVDGQVTAAESPRAPGLADLLTGCGRIDAEGWTEVLRLHGPRGRVGEALVERGLLTRGELELGHLGALFDAAYFILADRAGGTWRFEPDVRHWLGPVAAVDPARLHREVERRVRLLDRIWPWPQLDTAPVRPVEHTRRPTHRPPGRRRRELLDHADGRRTPADLARLLGRSGFGVTADVRRLAAAGLLDGPPPGAPPAGAPRPEGPRPEAPGAPGASGASGAGSPAAEADAVARPTAPGPPAPRSAAPRHAAPAAAAPEVPPQRGTAAAGGLHRRVPGATLRGTVTAGPGGAPAPGAPERTGPAGPGGPTATAPARAGQLGQLDRPDHLDRPPTTAAAHPLTVPDPDIALLTRVRDLLEARL
ncbi:hypothetical protein ABT247_13750 [Kitasatospora sp. NPDC001539]|uniref:hypothetical protein n=1 Tax=Kitasatospora sp. NPDC001539 TaxID=3154384 RepID=UPI0033196F45